MAKYKLGFDQTGKVLGIIANVYCDCGNSPNETDLFAAAPYMDNAYNCKNWHITYNFAKTNLPANAFTRS